MVNMSMAKMVKASAKQKEELSRSKEENERQHTPMDAVVKPEVTLRRQENSLDQEDPPEPPHIKEEQEELWISQEGEQLQGLEEADITKFLFTPVPVKSEDDEEKPQSSQLHQRQTEQMETGADGEDYGGPEPARNSHPDTNLLRKETKEPQSSKSRKNYVVPKSDKKHKTGDKSISCSECGKSFCKYQNLKIHMRTHTGEKPFSCSICGKGFSQKAHMTKHMELHTEERKFSCTVCGNSFSQRGHLTQHMLVHTGDKPFSCTGCDQRFSWSTQLMYHTCDGLLTSRLNQNQTEQKKDAEPQASSSTEQMKTGAVGEDCGGPEPARNSHPDPQLHPETKDKTEDSSESEDSEDDCKETKKPLRKTFSCSECGKTFNINGTLQRHMRIHTKEKPYTCTVCGKGFTQMVHLKKHAVVHTGNKPFGCSVCGKTFSFDANLHKHMKIHTGEKPFSCPFCGKTFIEKSKVAQHMVIHTGETPFSCTVCEQRFTWNKQLRNHKCPGPQSSLTHEKDTEDKNKDSESGDRGDE